MSGHPPAPHPPGYWARALADRMLRYSLGLVLFLAVPAVFGLVAYLAS